MAIRLLAFALCAAIAVPAAAQTAPTDEAVIATAIPRIDAMFEDFQKKNPTPGLVYGIVANGRLVHVRGFGVQDIVAKRPVTADSLFRIASMTKAFTALSILSLRDAGKLSLDDLAEKYVLEMRNWRYPTADSPRIRIRDLLSHVAGFVTDDPWGDRQTPLPEAAFTAMLKAGVPFTRPPRTGMEYSNFGYALLGRIVANVSGMPYRTYVERTILKPLGMASSGFEVGEWPIERRSIGYRWENDAWLEEPTMKHGAFGAMGGLQVSANDYAKWVGFLLSAWPPRDDADKGPVKRASVRELAQGSNFTRTRRRMGSTAESGCVQSEAYGMGFRVAQDCQLGLMMHHGGGYPGYGSHLLLLPEYGVGIFVFTNRTYTGAANLAWDAAFLLNDAGAFTPRELPVTPDLAAMHDKARAAYASGDVTALPLAMNFLMDRSAANWRIDLAKLREQLGNCPTAEPLHATGALTVAFRWNCEKGKLDGQILLAPTKPLTVQALRFLVVKQ
ncbi:serine hydrolase [Sphingomonas sp. AOB5]|uniref:serine hydrolase domain-containing protein n=1 Tax=Sphingomonas sp. AOB5 TaxID=3034017 RepID=UPI0023F928C7|nr:serine hydrolase domain-containing protein [Sphingomonas sp. AOB5]MDF7776508.1 serine hydrolase [Sphingomonas sp. AOB5]